MSAPNEGAAAPQRFDAKAAWASLSEAEKTWLGESAMLLGYVLDSEGRILPRDRRIFEAAQAFAVDQIWAACSGSAAIPPEVAMRAPAPPDLAAFGDMLSVGVCSCRPGSCEVLGAALCAECVGFGRHEPEAAR